MRQLLSIFFVAFAGFAAAQEQSPVTRLDAQSLEQAATLRDIALEHSEAYIITESLTSEIGARMAGTPADARAVAWAVTKFKELGYDRVYTEPVKFPVWQRRAESAEILSPFPHKLVLRALGGSSGTGRHAIEGEVIEFATYEALQGASASDVSGKIVFIGNRMRRAKDGSGYGPAVAARVNGPWVAAKLGAKAILIRSIGTDRDRLPHTGTAVSLSDVEAADPVAFKKFPRTKSGHPIVATPIPAAALSNPDADLLSRVLERSRPVRVRISLDVGMTGEEYTSANVIGEITGSEKPDEVVLIGGHLDSWDVGTGAIDDASGVAITMAAGHLIKRQGLAPRRTIRVVAFANEEQGVYGGRAYGAAHAGDVSKHLLGAESDFGAGKIWRLDSNVKPEALGAIDQMMQVLSRAGVTRGDATATGGADTSAMYMAGMSVLDLVQDGTTYFDYHHTDNDTLDKIDPADLNQNVAVYAVVAWLAAQAEGDFGSSPDRARTPRSLTTLTCAPRERWLRSRARAAFSFQ